MKRSKLENFRSRLKAYRRDEDGAILIFGLIAFVIMIMVGGMAVDMMRYESERVRLQGTADRAVLAAAMMRENPANPDPEDIVQSYFDAEGFGNHVRGRIRVTPTASGREVLVAPQGRMSTTFMRLSGVDRMDMHLLSAASEGLAEIEVEIVVVLDVSGSMRDHQRIDNLESVRSSV